MYESAVEVLETAKKRFENELAYTKDYITQSMAKIRENEIADLQQAIEVLKKAGEK